MAECPSAAWDRYNAQEERAASEREEVIALLVRHREHMEEDGYSATHCDCDPSVGINSCLYCETVAAVERYYDVGPLPEDER